MSSPSSLRPQKSTALSTGMAFVLLGLASLALARGRDGFDKGLFIGACVAFMVLGAYLLGSGTFRKPSDDNTTVDVWLPSRDER